MATADVTFTIDYTSQQLADLKKDYPNADGTVPSNAQVVVNFKAFWLTRMKHYYRSKRRDEQAAAISPTDLPLT